MGLRPYDDAHHRARDDLAGRGGYAQPEVTGVGVGFRRVAGRRTEQRLTAIVEPGASAGLALRYPNLHVIAATCPHPEIRTG